MTVIDDTFTAIVLRAAHDAPIPGREWVYYRHPEHGGLTIDPLEADRITNISAVLYAYEDLAKKHWPNRDWVRARLIVSVEPFSNPEALNNIIDHHLRREALKKLSLHERRALGLGSDG